MWFEYNKVSNHTKHNELKTNLTISCVKCHSRLNQLVKKKLHIKKKEVEKHKLNIFSTDQI